MNIDIDQKYPSLILKQKKNTVPITFECLEMSKPFRFDNPDYCNIFLVYSNPQSVTETLEITDKNNNKSILFLQPEEEVNLSKLFVNYDPFLTFKLCNKTTRVNFCIASPPLPTIWIEHDNKKHSKLTVENFENDEQFIIVKKDVVYDPKSHKIKLHCHNCDDGCIRRKLVVNQKEYNLDKNNRAEFIIDHFDADETKNVLNITIDDRVKYDLHLVKERNFLLNKK